MTQQDASPKGWLGKWNAMPLYVRIVIAMGAGLLTGLVLGERALFLEIPAHIILQLLGALAPPLILIAVTHVLMTTQISGQTTRRLAGLLLLNTTVAIVIGLSVANLVRPGAWLKIETPPAAAADHVEAGAAEGAGPAAVADAESAGEAAAAVNSEDAAAEPKEPPSPVELLVKNVPKSILGPLGDQQNIIGVIFIAVAFGIALRSLKSRPIRNVQDFVEIAYEVLLTVLHWLIQLVPIGVFSVVAKVIGTEGIAPFKAMGVFALAVLGALAFQTAWYLVRIRLFSWVRPLDMLRGMRDALVMAFSTGSSTATMPVTYACLKEKVGVREESASMGSLVGANFNNDGTALYEAMAALFVAQLIGQDLAIRDQLIIVLTSIIASVGAAGIPEAGIVTMTLVFNAVGLPTTYIAMLLTIDWFLDRCRTTVNVLGDVNVSCLLDGRTKPETPVETPVVADATT